MGSEYGESNSTLIDLCKSQCSSGVCTEQCLVFCCRNCLNFYSSSIPPPIIPSTLNEESDKPHKISPFLIATFTFLAAAVLVVCCYAIYSRFYLRRRNSSRTLPLQRQTEATHDEFLDEDDGPVVDHPIWYIRTVGLQPSVISSITVCKYKSGEGIVEGAECSVCLNEFQEDETLRLLPKCSHAFHVPCIDTWLRSHTNCPMCRAPIIKSTVQSPSPEPNVENPRQVEEAQVGNSQRSGGSGGEIVDEVRELRIVIEEEAESAVERCENSNEEVTGIQPMRRSVSMDSLSASKISRAVANILPVKSDGNPDTQLVKSIESNTRVVPKRVEGNQNSMRSSGSSSKGRSLPNGPNFMRRSFSGSFGTVFRSF
jgi:hypothetical protein